MSYMDRPMSREKDRPRLRHKESMESIKSVPMWDSSDPDRAPPPLPLNPATGQSPVRANASATIQAAASALADRARANTGPSPYTFNTMADRSPEKSPTRTPQHRRLQNLQGGGLKENAKPTNNENSKPSDWLHSPRPSTPTYGKDIFTSSPERSHSRADSLARTDSQSTQKDLFGSTPNLRHSSRPPIRAILSESSPRSPTMLAIQNMPHRDVSPVPTTVRDVSTSAVPIITYPTPSNLEAIHAQMLNLTNIATTLQKEMSALSRRSKDNATDLISIKEATNSRDEDIRKTLKDLATSVKTNDTGLHGAISGLAAFSSSRPTSVFASHSPNYLDSKPYHSPPFAKSTSLPRLDYGGSDIDRSASPYSSDGTTASLAMLEKIVREMATKDGHERILSAVSGMLEHSNKESSGTAKKIEQLVELIQEKSAHQSALVKRVSIGEGPPKLELDFDGGLPVSTSRDVKAAEVVTKELQEMLRKVKDSISQNGGMTGEIKNLVRELRGEVLGMGREIGRKLDEQTPMNAASNETQLTGDEVRSIIQEALSELKEQMENVVQSKRRQSSGSAVSKMTVDDSSVYAVVKHALAEHAADSKVDQEAILTAVKEAYEAYKPEIELQQFGLERDEILECLKEGLDDHRKSKAATPAAATREEILGAVQEALQHFTPSTPVSEAAEVKEELLATVKECLNEHATETRELVAGTNTSLTAEQMLDVVKAALEQSPAQNEEVLNALHDILSGMRGEVQQFASSSAEHNEQILSSISTGLEALRFEIAAIAQHGSTSALADEVNTTIADGLNNVKSTLEEHLAATQQSDRSLTKETVQTEFDRMHDALASHAKPATEQDTEAIISSLNGSIEELKATIQTRGIDEPMEEIMEAIKADFDALRDGILQGTARQRDELLEALQESLSNINDRSATLGAEAVSTAAIIVVIKDEFDALKESMAMSMMPVTSLDDKQHDTPATVKQALQDMRVQLSADHNDNAAETLGVLKEELQSFREGIASAVVPAAAGTGANIELLEAIRDGLDGLRNYSNRSEVDGATTDAIDFVRDELEQLRESIQTSMVKSNDDTLEAIQDGLNELKAKLENSTTGTDSAASNEVLEALGDGLVELKTEFAKLADKPIDMTTSYETLDLLKSGHSAILFEIERLRADFEKVQTEKDNEMVLADHNISSRDMAEEAAPRTANKEDLDKLEVMLAQLQIKIEAMSQNSENNMHDGSGAATLQAIANLEAMLEVIQATVAAGSHRTQASNSATKEDTDAIEVLLLNTKAKIEEELLPAMKGNVTKDDLDNVEALVRMTGESVDNLSGKLAGNVTTKEDLVVLEAMFEGVTAALQHVKEQLGALNPEESTLHSDIETLQTLCAEMQTKFPEEGQVSAKADIEQMVETMQSLQLGLDKLQSLHENDIEVTAKAFDDRETESKNILEQIDQVKLAVEESRDELKSRLKRGTKDVRALDEILQAIEERMDGAPDALPKVEEVAGLLKAEFERAHGSLETLTTNLDTKSAEIMDKHDDVRTAIIAGVAAKLDEHFEEQNAASSQAADSIDLIAKDLAGRAEQQEALLSDSRALSDELKLTIDTLGASVTSITPALTEATEKMSDDSRTVFNKIEQIHSKLEVDHAEAKDEHELTRAHLAKSLSTISLVREQLSQDHPKVMETLTSLLTMTGEHFEQSKQHYGHLKSYTDAATARGMDTEASFNEVKSALAVPRLMAPPGMHSPSEKESNRQADYALESKLDELLKHASTFQNNTANLEKLGQIHEQVMSTAAEVSAFVAFQTKMTTAVHDNKEEEAKDAAVNLSKNVAEAQQLESKIINLQDAKDNLAADIEALMAERDSLTSQKMRLNAEVSSLHTALEIRREELEMMDNRADALHRRIVEGVMNQSRALLMTKPKKNINMNLKRVGSNVSRATDATTTPSTLVSNGVGMAMNKPAPRKNDAPLSAGGRRIVSLGTTTGNTTPGGQRHAMSRNVTSGPISLKRVQSIKNSRLRNPTDDDQENNTQRLADVPESVRSASYAGSSGRSASYGTQPSEYSYGTGSYLTGSDLSDRRTSYGFSEANTRDRSSIGSTIRSSRVGASEYAESIYEDEENEREQEHDDEVTPEASPATEQAPEIDESGDQQRHIVTQKKQEERRHGDSDSGLGSDLPTAALSAQDFGGYFPERKEQDRMMMEG